MAEVKSFEEEKKERGIITISREDFINAVSDVMNTEDFRELSDGEPIVGVMYLIHSKLIENHLFNEE